MNIYGHRISQVTGVTDISLINDIEEEMRTVMPTFSDLPQKVFDSLAQCAYRSLYAETLDAKLIRKL